MNELLPVRLSLEVDEAILEDLLINLGVAQQHHSKVLHPLLDGGDLGEFIRACGKLEAASEIMWGYLRDRICFPSGYPPRLRDVLCLREMCRVFRYEARLLHHQLTASGTGTSWKVQVAVFDRTGVRIADAVAGSEAFDGSNHEASLGAFYAAAADAFREAARTLFPFGAPYDERDRTVPAAATPAKAQSEPSPTSGPEPRRSGGE